MSVASVEYGNDANIYGSSLHLGWSVFAFGNSEL